MLSAFSAIFHSILDISYLFLKYAYGSESIIFSISTNQRITIQADQNMKIIINCFQINVIKDSGSGLITIKQTSMAGKCYLKY